MPRRPTTTLISAPPAGDTAGTRDAILDAAERTFARQGYTATTIKQLAAAAGVTSALLYYYFPDKEGLYREVLRRMIATIAERGAGALAHAPTPDAAIRALVAAQTAILLERPELPKILIRELIDFEAAHADASISTLAAGTFKRLCTIIEHGQREGRFRPELDARFAAISIVAQIVYFHLARPAVGILLGYGPRGITAETARAFGAHAGEFALAALCAPATPARRRTQRRTAPRGAKRS